jgi:hypothetical protein
LKTKIEIEKTRMPLMYKIRRPCHERREERGERSEERTEDFYSHPIRTLHYSF